MKQNSSASKGTLRPLLFIASVFSVSLCLAFMVCFTVFHAIVGNTEEQPTVTNTKAEPNSVKTTAYVSGLTTVAFK
jgi:hypothetical protein